MSLLYVLSVNQSQAPLSTPKHLDSKIFLSTTPRKETLTNRLVLAASKRLFRSLKLVLVVRPVPALAGEVGAEETVCIPPAPGRLAAGWVGVLVAILLSSPSVE